VAVAAKGNDTTLCLCGVLSNAQTIFLDNYIKSYYPVAIMTPSFGCGRLFVLYKEPD
jgi:hypothetical protein